MFRLRIGDDFAGQNRTPKARHGTDQDRELRMILQQTIPYDVSKPSPLPGIAPLDPDGWLMQDDAFADQMQERARLLAERRAEVIAHVPGSEAAQAELLDAVLALVAKQGYVAGPDHVRRPDGVKVPVNREDPLWTMGHLVQEDLCILEKRGDEHVLAAAVLCFPASWTLSEKIGRPLIAIHDPVASYDANIARRVQRLFDGIKAGRPLWRFNVLHYADPTLYQPRSHHDPRPDQDEDTGPFLRSERQCLLRLPQTQAVVFSIHSFVVRVKGYRSSP